MLSEKDQAFITYWEQHRERENQFTNKLLGGMPMALLFSFPIILLLLVVRIFIPEWYMKMSKSPSGTFITITFALLITAAFFSFFRMQYKWEMNEQLYKELKSKQFNNQSADPAEKIQDSSNS